MPRLFWRGGTQQRTGQTNVPALRELTLGARWGQPANQSDRWRLVGRKAGWRAGAAAAGIPLGTDSSAGPWVPSPPPTASWTHLLLALSVSACKMGLSDSFLSAEPLGGDVRGTLRERTSGPSWPPVSSQSGETRETWLLWVPRPWPCGLPDSCFPGGGTSWQPAARAVGAGLCGGPCTVPGPRGRTVPRRSCRMPSARGCLAQSPRSPAARSPAHPGGKSRPSAPARPAVASALLGARWPACSLTKARTQRWMRRPVQLWCGPRPASPALLMTVPTGGTSAPGQSAPSPAGMASSAGRTLALDPEPGRLCQQTSASTCPSQ